MLNDVAILRQLASEYAEIARSDLNQERIRLHKQVNDLQMSRPIVLIDEIPWAEMNLNDELTMRCEDELLRDLEFYFRTSLYKWRHMPGDMVVTPYVGIQKVIHTTGIGFSQLFDDSAALEKQGVQAHQYVDQISTEADIDRLHPEIITYDQAATLARFNRIGSMIGDVLPVKIVGEATGYGLGCKPWDTISFLRGVDPLFYDLVDRPAFMHRLVRTLTDIFIDKIRQYDEQGLFDGDAYYNHSTAALTNDLHPDQSHVRAKDVWGRGLAQILASVSPAMHDEFDIQYMIEAMKPFGLVYYGCCEPLDRKIDIVSQLPNLRKISITPWANIELAAEAIGRRYVVSAKPNPANVLSRDMNLEACQAELTRIIDACRRNGCSCEIVLKDITSVSNRPQNLFEWEKMAMDLVQAF